MSDGFCCNSQQNVKIYCNSYIFRTIWDKNMKKHNGNIFETFKASIVVLFMVNLQFTKSPLAVIFSSILPKVIRILPMSNINDCTKFKDNWSMEYGVRVQTSYKNG